MATSKVVRPELEELLAWAHKAVGTASAYRVQGLCEYALELERRAAALAGYTLEGHDNPCSTCIAAANHLRELLSQVEPKGSG